MTREFTLPDTGEGLQEAEILEILVRKGDEVEQGQNVLVVETDKASLELPAPASGVVEKIHVDTGDTAQVGDVLMTFTDGKADNGQDADDRTESDDGEEQGDRSAAKEQSAEKERSPETETAKTEDEQADPKAKSADDDPEAEEETAAPKVKSADDEPERKEKTAATDEEAAPTGKPAEKTETGRESGPVKSVPATRRLARKLGVDIRKLTPTGENGRVTDADVRKAAERGEGGARSVSPELPDFRQWGEVAREPLRSVRRATADHMATSWREIPHVTHMDAVAIDVLEEFRRHHREDGADGGENLTLTAFVIKAAGVTLREHPRFNASLDADAQEVIYKQYRNIGVAVATDRGLLVPVVRDVDRKSVLEIAAEISTLSEKARNGKVSKDDLSGGCFTITNVGPLGGRAFTPIINWPEVAILGLGQARFEPVAEQEETGRIEFFPRLMLPLCLAFDHRVNDGADAARFTASLKEILDDPDQFLLAA